MRETTTYRMINELKIQQMLDLYLHCNQGSGSLAEFAHMLKRDFAIEFELIKCTFIVGHAWICDYPRYLLVLIKYGDIFEVQRN